MSPWTLATNNWWLQLCHHELWQPIIDDSSYVAMKPWEPIIDDSSYVAMNPGNQ